MSIVRGTTKRVSISLLCALLVSGLSITPAVAEESNSEEIVSDTGSTQPNPEVPAPATPEVEEPLPVADQPSDVQLPVPPATTEPEILPVEPSTDTVESVPEGLDLQTARQLAPPVQQNPNTRVVGGRPISIQSAPWQVALIDNRSPNDYHGQFCGGSIIDKRWILTAAHCLEDMSVHNIRVMTGKTILSSSSRSSLGVARTITHPNYNPGSSQHDIALVQLGADLAFSSSVSPIVPATSAPAANQAAEVSGWGFTCAFQQWPFIVGHCPEGGWTAQLNGANIQIHSTQFCQSQIGGAFQSQSMICASGRGNTVDTCLGDSGGPLAIKRDGAYTLSGITSWGYGCAMNYPGVYTNVANYSEWIAGHVISPLPRTERIAGANRFATAAQVSQDSFPNPSAVNTVVLATGHDFPDALSAAPLATKLGGPLLLTANPRLSSETALELKRLSPDRVIIVGSVATLAPEIEQAVQKLGFKTQRVFGANRFETSLEIAKLGWGSTGTSSAFMATGLNYPDALAAGAAAASQGIPVLLAYGVGDTLLPNQVTQMKRLNIQEVFIAGSANSVSSGIQSQMKNSMKLDVQRFAGADRVETSRLIAQRFGSAGKPVYVTNGWKFPDALTGAPAAGAAGGVLLLAPTTCMSSPIRSEMLRLSPSSVRLLGDRSSLTANIEWYQTC